MKKTIDYIALLNDKIKQEYNDFINQLKQMPPDEIINYSYQKVFKEDIVTAVVNSNLSQKEAKALYRLRNPLQDLYDEWLSNDFSYMNEIRDTISERAASAINEMHRNRPPER